MGIDKLAAFLEIEPEKLSGTLLEGEYVATSDLDFCLKQVID
ncbi:17478_t:CDS:2 [Racocetra fulgida]|uniref:17478_t:CDS:1 n=1 Tax=Racocetra fulgida TaxID=60492 RepID=A0A9N9FHX3_9GLOM|nr:17478_t:CDS:2 [Racocetra fulgida]